MHTEPGRSHRVSSTFADTLRINILNILRTYSEAQVCRNLRRGLGKERKHNEGPVEQHHELTLGTPTSEASCVLERTDAAA